MSDLRHQSPTELRRRLASVVAYRAQLENDWKDRETKATALTEEAATLRRKWHNAGVQEAWTRIYLARADETTSEVKP